MKLIFEFARIAAFCFAGEVCHLVLPLLALIPITILVMTVSGCVTQRLAERKEKKQ